MATEKVGVYRRWLEPVPVEDGKPIPRSQWPVRRRHSWTVRWFGTTGRRYSKDFETRKLAERHAQDLQAKVRVGTQDRPRMVTLHDFAKEHAQVMRGQVAYATLIDQNRALRLFEKHIGTSIRLQEIRPMHAESFVAGRLASGLAVGTVNKDIRTLKRIFNLAIEPRGYLAEGQNPFGKIKQRKKSQKPLRYVSVGEYRKVAEAAANLWWRALISIAYGSGLRKAEILNLTWADIDFERQQISVQAKRAAERTIEWEPKDHESRVVPMSAETTQLLADLQAVSEEGSPYIFISPGRLRRIAKRIGEHRWNGKSEHVNNMGKNFGKICTRARVGNCSLHDLRRSAITNWARRLPIQVVQQLAGHSKITTTREYYLAVRSEDLVAAGRLVDEILSPRSRD